MQEERVSIDCTCSAVELLHRHLLHPLHQAVCLDDLVHAETGRSTGFTGPARNVLPIHAPDPCRHVGRGLTSDDLVEDGFHHHAQFQGASTTRVVALHAHDFLLHDLGGGGTWLVNSARERVGCVSRASAVPPTCM